MYEAIDSEMTYQQNKWGATESSGRPGVGGARTLDEFALYIRGYSEDLAKIASHALDPNEKLDFVRKVAGLCVAAMEQHGAPHRK